MFYAQLITTQLNPWMYFDFKNNQLILKNQAQNVKFCRFTCIQIGNERFAVKKRNYY